LKLLAPETGLPPRECEERRAYLRERALLAIFLEPREILRAIRERISR
jgi:hypothetical protein